MKSKQLQKLALGAEIVSAIVVVATIGFLAVQTMENTNAVQAQMFQELMRDLNDWRKMISRPDYSAIDKKYWQEGWGSLDYEEQRQFSITNNILWGIYESAYFANEREILGPTEWSRFQIAICRRFSRDHLMWEQDAPTVRPVSQLLTAEFLEYVEGTCS